MGIKIPNAVLVVGEAKQIREVEEVIDFLKRYGPINRATVVDKPASEFDRDWVVEYSSGRALATLAPQLPYTFVTRDGQNTYLVQSLASMYTEKVGNSKTQAYLLELEHVAKMSGRNYVEVLKDMMTSIGASIPAPDSACGGEEDISEEAKQEEVFKDPSKPLDISHPADSGSKLPPTAHSARARVNPSIAASDINPPEVQRYVVEHILKTDDSSRQRLRAFSGKIPRPPHEADYDTWRSSVDLLLKDPAVSDLQRSRKLFESLLSPAADLVKHLKPDTLPTVYLQHLDSAFGTVRDGDELYATFMDTFQDSGEKPSAYLQRLQVVLTLAVKRGGVQAGEVNKHLLNQFCRGCWDNSLISELQLKQKKTNPPSFTELLWLLRTEEDRDAAKSVRMKQHLGATKQKVTSHQQVAYTEEDKSVCAALTTLTQQLTKQMAEIQLQLAALTANQSKPKVAPTLKGASTSRQSDKRSDRQPSQKPDTSRPKPGYCFRCGEDGHIRPQCDNEPNPALVAEKRRRFNGKCQSWEKNHPSAAHDPLN